MALSEVTFVGEVVEVGDNCGVLDSFVHIELK
jgi:hypothetical protein